MSKKNIQIALSLLAFFILTGLSCIFLLWLGQKVLA